MKINIVSSDERYKLAKDLLNEKGYEARLCTPDNVDECNCLLLSVRRELSDDELEKVLTRITKETVVLCGDDERIEKLFDGKIINYSKDSDFLLQNARLTSEATVSFLHNCTKDELWGKTVFVSGYGRIGRELCRILKSLRCTVLAYARREDVRWKIQNDGVIPTKLCDCKNASIIINTVPCQIYTQEIIDEIPKDALIVELASKPYGFANMNRVILGSALPGKILPIGASKVVCDTVCKILSETEKE